MVQGEAFGLAPRIGRVPTKALAWGAGDDEFSPHEAVRRRGDAGEPRPSHGSGAAARGLPEARVQVVTSPEVSRPVAHAPQLLLPVLVLPGEVHGERVAPRNTKLYVVEARQRVAVERAALAPEERP